MKISETTRTEVIKKAAGKCSICGRADVPLEIHHIVARAAGRAYTPDNLRAVCRACHVSTSHTAPEEFVNLKEELSKSYELEQTVANAFMDKGFAVISGTTGPYGGVDLIARGTDPVSKTKVTFLVECKYTRHEINKDTVAKFAAKFEQARGDYGLMVSSTHPTSEVSQFASSFGISVVSSDELSDYLGEFDEDVNSE